jgi:transforming growth factor-beta-induced protein
MRMRIAPWSVAVALIGLAGCADAPTEPVAADGSALVAESESEARWSKAAPSPTVVDVALSVNASTGEFSTLIAAVVDAGLVEALSAKGQRTVFAPTDAAFAALGLDATNIGDLDTATLQNILLYHVAPGRRLAEDVVDSDRIRMLNKQFNDIEIANGMAYIGGAQIIATDIEATNGVIHVIDAVLLPQ